MNKRVLIGLLSLAMVGVFSVPAWAVLPEERVKTETFVGIGPTLSTNITVNNRIIAFECSDTVAATCALYDSATTGGATNTTVFGEKRVNSTEGSVYKVFSYPRNIANGLVAMGTTANTVITVEYR